MESSHHIAVVDDDPDVRETLGEYLGDHGYKITPCAGGSDLRKLVESGAELDVVLLDIKMPDEDGLSLARYLTQETDARIIMVTASGETVDRIVGLEMGADDYVPKPFDLRELLARVKAVLRRPSASSKAQGRTGGDSESEVIQFGTCRLDLGAHALFDEDGKEIKLTAMEFDLLRVFAERPNRVLSRDSLLELAHHGHWDPYDRSIDIRISRMRRKIERDPGKPEVLKTVRGAGYMFVSKT
jgi:two-component system phosphate regulon response regulator OmpR